MTDHGRAPSGQAGQATPRARKRSRPVGDHPSRSMVPYGPEHPDYPDAPGDWDGGPYLCRDGELYHMRGYGWGHGLGCWNATADWDRIAYRRRDSDGSGEAVETAQTGSTVGDSADPKGIAQ